MTSIAQVCHAIWELEHRLDLIEAEAAGVPWWPTMRVEVYYRLTRALGLNQDPNPGHEPNRRWPRLHKTLGKLPLAWNHPLRRYRSARYLVLTHERKSDRGAGPVDIYAERLQAELPVDDTVIVDSPFRGAYSPHAGQQIIRHDELKTMARSWKKAASDWRPTTGQTQQFQATERAFAETFGVELPLAEMIPRRIRSFRAEAGIYGELMERLGTQTVFVVVGYFKHAVVAAARQRRIPVHELQHSAITPYSLGYSYPGRPEVATSPDTVLCFGSFWTHATEFPSNTTPRIIGRPRVMDAELSRAGVKRPRHVLVISQSVLGQALLTLVARAAALAPDYRFVFRPHPSELESDLHGSLAAAGLAQPANLSIGSGGEPLYRQLAEAALQVGVFSTGLFEGMMLGCCTIVADLPGAEAMGAVIERGDALLVETPEDLVAALPHAPIAEPTDYYAEPVASILQLLDS